jgi:cupin fold WbuC family metalloprotein
MTGFHATTPSVFETHADPVLVSQADMELLIGAARSAPNKRARLILHGDRQDSLHEMVIALPMDSCDHPHTNYKSGKSFLALSGQFAVVYFSDDGVIAKPIVLSANADRAGDRMVRFRRPTWHTIVPLAGDTVLLETVIGPFEGNRFAPWFPGEDRPAERQIWATKLRALSTDAASALRL